ncbi:hypothetical protein KIN20_036048 [Parelaphostrongylus tenuis]|uniref:Uncharacterized protein n=1 Tax=Parelaphostrongylus tenuis TaxID=148309 RepID=A0AAD5WK54_PARTN|nr:hypothetical protein KIN20_036048 [Parelaphostrongylus tenuis]
MNVKHLSGKLGGPRSPVCELLYEGARLAWQKLTPHEKQIWANRALELERLDPHRRCFNIPKDNARSRRRRAAQREDFRGLPFEADDDVAEDEFFTVGRAISASEEGAGCYLLIMH